MVRKKVQQMQQNWRIGDVFLVETKDGKFVIGQVVGQEQDVLNSATCAFFDVRVSEKRDADGLSALPVDRVFSVLFVTRDLLDEGVWPIVGNRSIGIKRDLYPYESLREAGYIGAKVIGSGNVKEFLDAFYALSPWDAWHDPLYFDKLLVSIGKKPSQLVYKKG